jgi:hypothetical protein
MMIHVLYNTTRVGGYQSVTELITGFATWFYCLLLSLEQANNLREVQAMKRLNPHPNIIQLHELIL